MMLEQKTNILNLWMNRKKVQLCKKKKKVGSLGKISHYQIKTSSCPTWTSCERLVCSLGPLLMWLKALWVDGEPPAPLPPAKLKRRRSTPQVWSKYQVPERHKDIPFHQIKELRAGSRCSAAVFSSRRCENVPELHKHQLFISERVSVLKDPQPHLFYFKIQVSGIQTDNFPPEEVGFSSALTAKHSIHSKRWLDRVFPVTE